MSRFENFINTPIRVKGEQPLNEQIFIDDCIINFEDGHISNWYNESEGGIQPAIECIDGHIEFWEHGTLHSDNGPAVISSGDNIIEYWKNGKKTGTGKYYPHDHDKYFTLGKKAEKNFARYLNEHAISFIHLDQPSGESYSQVFRDNNIKRSDYVIFEDKKPFFVDVKATGCYKIYKTELERLHNFEKKYSLPVIFGIIDIHALESNDFAFISLDTMISYVEIFKKNIPNSHSWKRYPIPKKLLTTEMASADIADNELTEIFQIEHKTYSDHKHRFDKMLDEYLNSKGYLIGKTKEDNA